MAGLGGDVDERAELVGDIYEAALLPERWTEVVEAISRRHGFCGGAIVSEGANWTISPSLEPIFEKFVAGGWLERNERFTRLLRDGGHSFLHDFDLFTPEEWARTPVYRDFLVPHGHGYGAGTLVHAPGASPTAVVLERKLASGPTDPATMEALNALRPHIARALALAVETRRRRMQDLLAGLDLACVAAAVVSHGGRVLAANAGFAGLDPQVRVGARDRLSVGDARAQSLVREAVERADRAPAQSVPIPALGEGETFILHVIPLRKAARDLAPLGAAILVAFRRLGTAQEETGAILRGLYDLTRAEARTALGILDGRSTREIASDAGISIETVRTMLKSVFAKTGSNGQVDLVRRLSVLSR